MHTIETKAYSFGASVGDSQNFPETAVNTLLNRIQTTPDQTALFDDFLPVTPDSWSEEWVLGVR